MEGEGRKFNQTSSAAFLFDLRRKKKINDEAVFLKEVRNEHPTVTLTAHSPVICPASWMQRTLHREKTAEKTVS